jgi:hypothetical protein
MKNPEQSESPFSDRHEVVKTVCVWRDRTCYRIEIIKRISKEAAYAALLWIEEEQGGRRVLVRDVSFTWVHHETPESAMDHAMESLTAKLTYAASGESEG